MSNIPKKTAKSEDNTWTGPLCKLINKVRCVCRISVSYEIYCWDNATSQIDKKNIIHPYSFPAEQPLFLCLLDHRLTNYVLYVKCDPLIWNRLTALYFVMNIYKNRPIRTSMPAVCLRQAQFLWSSRWKVSVFSLTCASKPSGSFVFSSQNLSNCLRPNILL